MSDIECPICDVVLEGVDLVYVTGVSGVSVPTEESLTALQAVEETMSIHIGTHSTADIIEAFQKADAYIAQLEERAETWERRYMQNERAEGPVTIDKIARAYKAEPDIPLPPADVMAPSPQAAMALPEHDDGYVQPDRRSPVRDPALGPGQRPEGIVARR